MSRSTISTFQLFALFPDEESARKRRYRKSCEPCEGGIPRSAASQMAQAINTEE